MAPYETERELTEKDGDHVKHIRVRRTDSEKYPCGYDYALHYGTIDGETLLRYDNAHEQHKGHERHTPDGTTEIEFPSMAELIRQFESEIEKTPAVTATQHPLTPTHDGIQDTRSET